MSLRTPDDYGLWEIAVLATLRERAMHPYEILRLLKARHKDDFLVLKRGSLYHAIARLVRDQAIEEVSTSREGRHPERTTYRLSDRGRETLLTWLRRKIATPLRERSEFLGCVSFLVHLAPAEAAEGLESRLRELEATLRASKPVLDEARRRVGRIHLVESEYAGAMMAAEAAWVRRLLADVRSGALAWETSAVLRQAAASAPETPTPTPPATRRRRISKAGVKLPRRVA